MTEQLKIYLCPKSGGGTDGDITITRSCGGDPIEHDSEALVVDESRNRVTARLLPSDSQIAAVVPMLNDSYVCYNTGLEYYRGIERGAAGHYRNRHSYLTFQFNKWPAGACAACGWKYASLTRRNMITCDGCLFYLVRPDPPQNGPVPDSRSDVFLLDRLATWDCYDPECVPGELILLTWCVRQNHRTRRWSVGSVRFRTPAFDGGRITGITGSMTPDRQITVDVPGAGEFALTPTDFADYQTGSWVYLLQTGDVEARIADRQTEYSVDSDTEELANPAAQYRPFPAVFNGSQNSGLVNTDGWTPREYSLVDNFEADFETAYHEGTIIAIDRPSGTATVDIDGVGQMVEVPFFYHCPNADDTINGHTAFSPDDRVLVIDENASYTIVGFVENNLNACMATVLVVKADSEYLLWDMVNNNPAMVYDESGDVVNYPLSASAFDALMAYYNFIESDSSSGNQTYPDNPVRFVTYQRGQLLVVSDYEDDPEYGSCNVSDGWVGTCPTPSGPIDAIYEQTRVCSLSDAKAINVGGEIGLFTCTSSYDRYYFRRVKATELHGCLALNKITNRVLSDYNYIPHITSLSVDADARKTCFLISESVSDFYQVYEDTYGTVCDPYGYSCNLQDATTQGIPYSVDFAKSIRCEYLSDVSSMALTQTINMTTSDFQSGASETCNPHSRLQLSNYEQFAAVLEWAQIEHDGDEVQANQILTQNNAALQGDEYQYAWDQMNELNMAEIWDALGLEQDSVLLDISIYVPQSS